VRLDLRRADFVPLLWAFAILVGLGVAAWLLTPLTAGPALSLAFALWFYLVLPGYCILLHLELDGLERVVLALPVSGALIPILLYHWNVVGGRISLAATVAFILLVSGIALGALALRRGSAQDQSLQKDS